MSPCPGFCGSLSWRMAFPGKACLMPLLPTRGEGHQPGVHMEAKSTDSSPLCVNYLEVCYAFKVCFLTSLNQAPFIKKPFCTPHDMLPGKVSLNPEWVIYNTIITPHCGALSSQFQNSRPFSVYILSAFSPSPNAIVRRCILQLKSLAFISYSEPYFPCSPAPRWKTNCIREMALQYQSLNILQAEILVGGLEAQLLFSVEGINIPEGLHNKAKETAPCHLKPGIYICL